MNCGYCNRTARVQIARVVNSCHPTLERAVFPGQSFLFEASPEAQLEIYTGETVSSVLADRIHCRNLQTVSGPLQPNE
jgi:hypothetical protein